MSWRVCSKPGCGTLHQGTGRCDACRTTDARTRHRSPQGRNPYTSRGHQAFRQGVLARQPRCVCDGECGAHDTLCARPSTVADHHPLERVDLIAACQDPNDPAHGRGLCASCHSGKTARTRPGGFNDRT